MKELDIWVFVAVFQEMLGPALWLLLGLAVVVVASFIAVVLRDRGFSSRRFVRAQIVGVIGGIVAILVMQRITHSGFADVGGPIDVMLIALIWLVGAIGTTMLAYVAQSFTRAEPVKVIIKRGRE
jgi:hypothetical protein